MVWLRKFAILALLHCNCIVVIATVELMQVKGPSFWRISIFTRCLHEWKQSNHYSWNKKSVHPLLNDFKSLFCLSFVFVCFAFVWSIEIILVMACVQNFFHISTNMNIMHASQIQNQWHIPTERHISLKATKIRSTCTEIYDIWYMCVALSIGWGFQKPFVFSVIFLRKRQCQLWVYKILACNVHKN